jgi:hypothetical protein
MLDKQKVSKKGGYVDMKLSWAITQSTKKRERGYVGHGKNPKNVPRYLTSTTFMALKLKKGMVAQVTDPFGSSLSYDALVLKTCL